MRLQRYFSPCLFLLVCVLGCSGSNNGRLEVSGTITFKDKPLDQGIIQFFTTESNEMAGSASIKDGKYLIPAVQGIKPGTYRVVITSGEPGTKAEEGAPGMSGPPAKERIPADYNTNSLKKPVLREITADKKNDINFDIK